MRPFHGLRAAVRAARRPVWKFDAVRQQKIQRGHTLVAEGSYNFPVAEPVVVPLCQVLKHAVRRILNAVLLLQTRAAAESDVAAAFDGVSANVVVLLHHNDGGPLFGGGNRRRKSGGARAYHDDVGGEIPMPLHLRGLRLLCAEPAKCSRAQAGGRLPNKSSARQCRIFRVTLAHAFILPWSDPVRSIGLINKNVITLEADRESEFVRQ